ncbi:MAG: c-type cytochrome, partial [Phycisphaeraceae bacterium]|nr:c-type cytochrome [Phycisphaeraceae bacterium]
LSFVEKLLQDKNVQRRIVAYRALRYAAPGKLLDYAAVAAKDKSPAVRREAALSLRDVPLDQSRAILKKIIQGYDGKNRWYLEAIGTAAALQEPKVYDKIVKPMFASVPHADWGERAKNLAWRMHTRAAVDDLNKVIRAQKPDIQEFRHLIMAFTMYTDEADRQHREKIVRAFAEVPAFGGEDYQLTIREVLLRDIIRMPVTPLDKDYKVPASFGAETKVSDVKTISGLKGDAKRGKARSAICLTCHRIGDSGVAFGPNLSAWGSERSIEEIVGEIVEPAKKLAHGYEQPIRLRSRKGKVAEGIMMNYSYHAGSLKMKLFGGQYLKFAFRKHGLKIKRLKNHSWMPPASKMGLSDQDVRDIAEYLKTR